MVFGKLVGLTVLFFRLLFVPPGYRLPLVETQYVVTQKTRANPIDSTQHTERLYLVPRLSLWLLPCILVLLPQSNLADTIIFYDLSDTVTVSVTTQIEK